MGLALMSTPSDVPSATGRRELATAHWQPSCMPAPRNLVRGAYRFRSTDYGAAPLDSDIIRSTAQGLGETSMGRFMALGSQRLEDVSIHLMTFAPALFAATPPTFTGSPLPTGASAQIAERGRTVYEEARCWECHGQSGRGNGPSAPTLKDDDGRPVIASDFTKRWQAKAGSGAPDVFRSFLPG